MTKILEKIVRNKDTGEKIHVLRDMTEKEQAAYDYQENKKRTYLELYSDNLDALNAELEVQLEEHRRLSALLEPVSSEINSLRYISQKIRQGRGERVELMGS